MSNLARPDLAEWRMPAQRIAMQSHAGVWPAPGVTSRVTATYRSDAYGMAIDLVVRATARVPEFARRP